MGSKSVSQKRASKSASTRKQAPSRPGLTPRKAVPKQARAGSKEVRTSSRVKRQGGHPDYGELAKGSSKRTEAGSTSQEASKQGKDTSAKAKGKATSSKAQQKPEKARTC